MESSIIERGLDLMLFGMGTVFVFLTVLIFATTAMSAVISKWFPEKVVEAATSKKRAASPSLAIAPAKLNILQAAIDKHRNR